MLCLKRVVSGGDYLTWSDSSKGIIPVLGQDFQPIQTQVKKSNTALGSLDYTPGSSDGFQKMFKVKLPAQASTTQPCIANPPAVGVQSPWLQAGQKKKH